MILTVLRLICVSLFCPFFYVQSIAANPIKAAIIVAQVNEKVITSRDLENRIKLSKKFDSFVADLDDKSLVYNILDELIEESMVLQEGRRVNINIPDEEISSVIARVKKNQPKLYDRLRSDLIIREMKSKIKSNLVWSKILTEVVKPSLKNISKPQIIETLEELDQETSEFKFNISQIKIKNPTADSKLLMEGFYKELESGKKAKKILDIYEKEDTLFDFQNIGWVVKSDIEGGIHEAIISAKNIGYTKPILVNNQYVIFKINDRIITSNISRKSYAMAENKIYNSLAISSGKSFLLNLKKRTFIEIHRNRINGYFNLR